MRTDPRTTPKWVKPIELSFTEPTIADPAERSRFVRTLLARHGIRAGRQIDVVKALGRP